MAAPDLASHVDLGVTVVATPAHRYVAQARRVIWSSLIGGALIGAAAGTELYRAVTRAHHRKHPAGIPNEES